MFNASDRDLEPGAVPAGPRPDEGDGPGEGGSTAPSEGSLIHRAHSVRDALARNHLRLDGLEPTVRRLALGCLAVVALAMLGAIAGVLGVPFPGGMLEVPGSFVGSGTPVQVAHLLVLGFLLGESVVAAAAVAFALVSPRRLARLAPAGVAVWLSAMLAGIFTGLRSADVINDIEPVALLGLVATLAAFVVAVVVLLAGALARPGGGLASRRGRLMIIAAVLPGVVASIAYVAGLSTSVTLGEPRPVGLESWPAVTHLTSAAIGGSLFRNLTGVIPLLIGPVVLWEAATWARASRAELAAPLVRRVDARPWLVLGIIGAKVAWIALGYLGRLPASLGGHAAGWSGSLSAPVPAWIVAGLFGAMAGLWLARPSRLVPDERRIGPGIAYLVLGFSAPAAIGAVLLVLAAHLASLIGSGAPPVAAVVAAAGTSGDLITPVTLATAWLAPVAGLLAYRRGQRSLGMFLAVASVWMAPRAIDVTIQTLRLAPPEWKLPIVFDLVTMDTVVTAVVAVLAVAWIAGRQRGADGGSLVLVLVVSTLIAHAGTIVPSTAVSSVAQLAILFPALRELAFGSAELNERSILRSSRILGSLVRQSGVVLLAVTALAMAGGGSPDEGLGRIARLLFGPPIAAFLVAAAVVVRRRAVANAAPERPVEPERPVVSVRRHGAGLAWGIGIVAIAAVVGAGVLDPVAGWAWAPLPVQSGSPGASSGPSTTPSSAPSGEPSSGPSASPTDRVDAATILALDEGLRGVLQLAADKGRRLVEADNAGDTASVVTLGEDLAAEASTAVASLDAVAIPTCAGPLVAGVRGVILAWGDVGSAMADRARGTGSSAAVADRATTLQTRINAFTIGRDATATACGVTLPPLPTAPPATSPTPSG